VDLIVKDGDLIPVGRREVRALATPGHSGDHFAYLVDEPRAVLFSGDSVLAHGRVIVQNIPDCVLVDYVQTIRKLAALDIHTLLPGHGMLALNRGGQHLQAAVEMLDRLQIPPNLVV
jgi:glyoxylase-like metal-dependent hydrolase (beta-lactamase superfamily II)